MLKVSLEFLVGSALGKCPFLFLKATKLNITWMDVGGRSQDHIW